MGPRGEKKDPTSLGKSNHEMEKDSHEMEVWPRKTTSNTTSTMMRPGVADVVDCQQAPLAAHLA